MQSLINIFKKLHIPQPQKTISQIFQNDNHSLYNFFLDNIERHTIKKQIGGEKKIKYIYNGDNFIFYEYHDLTHNFSIYRKNDTQKSDCIIIMIDDEGIANIQNIHYYPDCLYTGLKYPGGGTILLRMAIQFIKDIKKKYKIKKIQLTDNSSLSCTKITTDIDLPSLYILTKGDTWYGKHGFKPYDSKKNKLDIDKYAEYVHNQKIVKKTLVKNTNLFKIFNEQIEKNNLREFYKIENINKFFKKFNDRCVMDFFKELMSDKRFPYTCDLFVYTYKKVMKDLDMESMYGWNYYLDV